MYGLFWDVSLRPWVFGSGLFGRVQGSEVHEEYFAELKTLEDRTHRCVNLKT
jgi:hypothetical protein